MARRFLGRFSRTDPHSAAAFDVDKGRGHLTPIAKFQSPFAQAAASDHRNRVGGAAIDLHERDQALAIFSAWIEEAEAGTSQHRHAYAKHLAGAEMAVSNFGFLQ
jgi:hypothetical protein